MWLRVHDRAGVYAGIVFLSKPRPLRQLLRWRPSHRPRKSPRRPRQRRLRLPSRRLISWFAPRIESRLAPWKKKVEHTVPDEHGGWKVIVVEEDVYKDVVTVEGVAQDGTLRVRIVVTEASLTLGGNVVTVTNGRGFFILGNTGAAGTPLTTADKALLTVDVWEHAYYIDYRNLRPKFVETFLDKLVNWGFAESNFA